MGMYTELIFGATLKVTTPTYVTDAFNYVINKIDNEDANLPDETKQFIYKYSLRKLVWCTSYYFGAHDNKPSCIFDEIDNRWCISFRANCKNYHGEIEKFIEFIKPYVEYGSGPTNIFAIVQYEEDEYPTLYGTEGKYEYLDKERITTDRKFANELIDITNDLYDFGSPDLVIDKNKLEEYNIDEDNFNTIDGYKIMVDIIKKRLRGNGVTEDFGRLAKEKQELKEKLMFTEFERDEYLNRVKQLRSELEACKHTNTVETLTIQTVLKSVKDYNNSIEMLEHGVKKYFKDNYNDIWYHFHEWHLVDNGNNIEITYIYQYQNGVMEYNNDIIPTETIVTIAVDLSLNKN